MLNSCFHLPFKSGITVVYLYPELRWHYHSSLLLYLFLPPLPPHPHLQYFLVVSVNKEFRGGTYCLCFPRIMRWPNAASWGHHCLTGAHHRTVCRGLSLPRSAFTIVTFRPDSWHTHSKRQKRKASCALLGLQNCGGPVVLALLKHECWNVLSVPSIACWIHLEEDDLYPCPKVFRARANHAGVTFVKRYFWSPGYTWAFDFYMVKFWTIRDAMKE